jgi:hypothetical protein
MPGITMRGTRTNNESLAYPTGLEDLREVQFGPEVDPLRHRGAIHHSCCVPNGYHVPRCCRWVRYV